MKRQIAIKLNYKKYAQIKEGLELSKLCSSDSEFTLKCLFLLYDLLHKKHDALDGKSIVDNACERIGLSRRELLFNCLKDFTNYQRNGELPY